MFKICFSRSCSTGWANKQTYFGNFTRPQTLFGRPKPSGKCQVTPLAVSPLSSDHKNVKHDKFEHMEL